METVVCYCQYVLANVRDIVHDKMLRLVANLINIEDQLMRFHLFPPMPPYELFNILFVLLNLR